MTHTNEKNDQDRGIWEQYRRTWPENLREQAGPDPDGEDANQIAAFLYNRLSKRERSAIEQRMAHEPAFRDAIIAARDADLDLDGSGGSEPSAAPASLQAWAKNMKPLHGLSGRMPTQAPPSGRGGFFLRPVVGFACGMAFLGVVAGFGIFKAIESDSGAGPVASKSEPKAKPTRNANADKIDPDKNSIFSSDPDIIFDGLDVDPD